MKIPADYEGLKFEDLEDVQKFALGHDLFSALWSLETKQLASTEGGENWRGTAYFGFLYACMWVEKHRPGFVAQIVEAYLLSAEGLSETFRTDSTFEISFGHSLRNLWRMRCEQKEAGNWEAGYQKLINEYGEEQTWIHFDIEHLMDFLIEAGDKERVEKCWALSEEDSAKHGVIDRETGKRKPDLRIIDK